MKRCECGGELVPLFSKRNPLNSEWYCPAEHKSVLMSQSELEEIIRQAKQRSMKEAS